jgi:hypothetical protein
MKPISTKFDERIQKNATKHWQKDVAPATAVEKKPKALVYNSINANLKWFSDKYQKATL